MGAKVPELKSKEVGINIEGGIFWKKTQVHNCNKQGVEGGKKIKINKRVSMFIMRDESICYP